MILTLFCIIAKVKPLSGYCKILYRLMRLLCGSCEEVVKIYGASQCIIDFEQIIF